MRHHPGMVWPASCAGALRALFGCGLLVPLFACGRVGLELIPRDAGIVDIDGGPIADVDSDCPTPCENPHGRADCSSGTCRVTCNTNWADCDGDPTNGCESSLKTSMDHCGRCGVACTNPGGSAECIDAVCTPICTATTGDCDGDPRNGCEVDFTSPRSCGACDTVCENPNGTVRCGGATCAPVCRAGFGDCDGDPQNGCETDLAGGTVCPTVCDLQGVFAIKLAFPSTWPSSLLVSSGSGTFVFWAKIDVTGGPDVLAGSIVPCGQTVPDFRAAPLIGERYGLNYPASLFTGTFITGAATSFTVSAPYPGSDFALARSPLLFGVSLADPLNGPWPSASALVSADADADGKPALTASYKTGPGYTNPPTDNFGADRADRGYIASRIVFELSGTLTSCNLSQGAASTRGLDAHTVGCRLAGGGRDCNASEADHLDSNAPRFTLGAGTYSMARVPENADCAAVQRALP